MTRTGTVLLAHGSARGEQRPVITQWASLLTEADAFGAHAADHVGTSAAFIDHHGPSLEDAVDDLVALGAERIVVVPALLSNAFHARHDVPRLLRNAAARSSVPVVASEPVGLDERLGLVVNERADATGIDDIDHVVVAAAGTSAGAAREEFRRAVRSWRGRRPWRLNAAFIAGGDPQAVELVTTLVDQNQRVVVVPFLFGEGAMHRRLSEGATDAGALAIAEVIGADPALVAIARERRDAVPQ
jgi:sirohydrochlorin ferrochelatase